MNDFKNYHKKRPILIVCNGPSLGDVPADFLREHITMGCNSIYTRDDFLCDWYMIEGINHLLTEEERDARKPYIRKVGTCGGYSLVNRRMVQHFEHLPNVRSIDYQGPKTEYYTSFQFTPFDHHGMGACVTFAMLQFAHFLTEGPVLIVGMDHKFSGTRWHYYKKEDAPEFEEMGLEEYAKFRHRVDPKFAEVAVVFEETDREIYNLTPDSACNAFPLGNLEDWNG